MRTVLVVDDDETFREMVVTILRREGFEILEAESGMEGIELAKAHHPDLIVSDVMMYSGSGFILREFLKRDAGTVKIPLILMSGKAHEAGAWGSDPDVEYLSKPFSSDNLLEIVNRLLDTKPGRK